MLSTSTWIILIIVLIIVDQVFITPLEDHQRYKLFEARDNITMEVLGGRISENDKSYKFVLDYLNFWLFYSKNDYDFSIVLKNILHLKPSTKREMNELVKQINENPVLQNAMYAADYQSKYVMRVKGFIFVQVFLRMVCYCLYVLLVIIEAISSIWKVGKSFVSFINGYIEKTNQTRKNYSLLESMYKRI